MIGQTRLLATLAKLAKQAKADGVSCSARAATRRVFRFADGAIHQDVMQERVEVAITVIRGARLGVATTHTLDTASLTRCLRRAEHLAEHAPTLAPPPVLPHGHKVRTRADYLAAAARATPEACATLIKRWTHQCRGAGATLAGSLSTGEEELAVVNTERVSCYAAWTIAAAKLVPQYRALSGFSSAIGRSLQELAPDALLARALRQCLHRREPVRMPLGTYEVILEPDALAELMEWLAGIAFSPKSVQDRLSFLAGRMGETVMDPQITIYDDGNEPGTIRLPFDYEGVPRRRVSLIERGKAAGIVYDTGYGARFGVPSTGHALPPDDAEGPMPLHLALAPGSVSVEAMIGSCRRGLLIPRFHYVNGLLNPREALMTGLTREGAFLIEDGALAAPIATLRFTQSLLEALSSVRGVSAERRLIGDPGTGTGLALMPAVHLAGFRFTGQSA
ncbi:MAG TPA: TldD/PmbA family protein [bacterium]